MITVSTKLIYDIGGVKKGHPNFCRTLPGSGSAYLRLFLGSLTIVIASSSVCYVYAELGIIMEGLYALVEIAP